MWSHSARTALRTNAVGDLCLRETTPLKQPTNSFPAPSGALHHLWVCGKSGSFLSGCSGARLFSAASPFTTTARTCELGDSHLEGLLTKQRKPQARRGVLFLPSYSHRMGKTTKQRVAGAESACVYSWMG